MTYRGRNKETKRAQHRQLVRWIASHPECLTVLMSAYVRYVDLHLEHLKARRRRA